MRQTLAVLVCTILAPLACYGQITGPAEANVRVGRLGTIIVAVDADEVTYKLIGDSFDGFREAESDSIGAKRLRIRILGYEAGKGYLIVVGTKGGKLLSLYTCAITIGEPAPPKPPVPPDPPKPPTPPDPPVPPSDPLAALIRVAAAIDNASPATLQTIADGFRSAAITSARANTASELQKVVIEAMTSTVGKLPTRVKGVLNDELKALDAVLPPDKPDAALTDANRATAKALFLKLAKACEAAK